MAKLSELVKAAAKSLGRPENSVTQTARHLREAGLIRTGGRGPGGAEMTASDAANLLIGILASEEIKDSPATVLAFRQLDLHYDLNRREENVTGEDDENITVEYRNVNLGDLDFLNQRGLLLGDALEQVLDLAASGALADYMTRLGIEGREQAGWPVDIEQVRRLVEDGFGHHFELEFWSLTPAAWIRVHDYWSGYGNANSDPLINAGFVADEGGQNFLSNRTRGDETIKRSCGLKTILALGHCLAGGER